jgi:hypothetical protein
MDGGESPMNSLRIALGIVTAFQIVFGLVYRRCMIPESSAMADAVGVAVSIVAGFAGFYILARERRLVDAKPITTAVFQSAGGLLACGVVCLTSAAVSAALWGMVLSRDSRGFPLSVLHACNLIAGVTFFYNVIVAFTFARALAGVVRLPAAGEHHSARWNEVRPVTRWLWVFLFVVAQLATGWNPHVLFSKDTSPVSVIFPPLPPSHPHTLSPPTPGRRPPSS